jgi:hypothetical protein
VWGAVAALCGAFVLCLMIGSARYLPFISDDALISLRYAQRLLDGQGLTWTSGRPVEGYSNLLWTLCAAGLGALGVDLIDGLRLLGYLSFAVLGGAVAWTYVGAARPSLLVAAIALGIMAATGSFAAWSIGGLEQPMVCAWLGGALACVLSSVKQPNPSLRSMHFAGACFALLCLTRPDSPLFVVATFTAWVAARRLDRQPVALRRVVWIVLWPMAAVVAQLVFRLTYYGEWIPNTALVKVALTSERVYEGLSYLHRGMAALTPLPQMALASVILCLSDAGSRSRCLLLSANGCAWLVYVAVIGGDIFPAFRHFVPVILVMAWLIGEGAYALLQRGPAWFRWLYVAACVGVIIMLWVGQLEQPDNKAAAEERWEWQCKSLALMLKSAFKERDVLVAVTAAGCLPFWSELEAIDLLGLNDYYLPRHRPAGFGRGPLAHELGDVKYTLGRKPDLIVFGAGRQPRFNIGRLLAREPAFIHGYPQVLLATGHPEQADAVMYVNRTSPRVGIIGTRKSVRVPGYFLQGGLPIGLDQHGALAGRLAGERGAWLDLPAGTKADGARVHSIPSNATTLVPDQRNERRIFLKATAPGLVTVQAVELSYATER